jgi:hypothetical protein
MTADGSITFAAVPPNRVETIWPLAKPHLKRAAMVTNGVFSIDDIERSVFGKEVILWVVMQGGVVIAALTTRVMQYPSRKALAIDWVGGSKIKEWMGDCHSMLVDFAKKSECSHLEGYGVRAWGRLLSDRGWKQAYITYRMELQDERR